jgi:hypothetical protein
MIFFHYLDLKIALFWKNCKKIIYSKNLISYKCIFPLFSGGEKRLGIPAAVKFPHYDIVTQTQKFPFKTLCMLCALSAHLLASTAARFLFEHGYLDAGKYDILNAFPHLSNSNSDTGLNKESQDMSLSGIYTRTDKQGIVNSAAVTDSTDDVQSSNMR